MTTISKDDNSFNFIKEHYQELFIKGGHKKESVYNAEKSNDNKRKWKNTLYFTTSFYTTVETIIGKRFLEIFSRNFDSTHPYHKMFYRQLLVFVLVDAKHKESNNVAQSENLRVRENN